jgi:hypothetical protein
MFPGGHWLIWVKIRRDGRSLARLLYPQQRTRRLMPGASAKGQKLLQRGQSAMSALLPKADIPLAREYLHALMSLPRAIARNQAETSEAAEQHQPGRWERRWRRESHARQFSNHRCLTRCDVLGYEKLQIAEYAHSTGTAITATCCSKLPHTRDIKKCPGGNHCFELKGARSAPRSIRKGK